MKKKYNLNVISDNISNDNKMSDGVRMQKNIGLIQGITIIIGSMIGSGIFVSPTGILQSVKSVGASLVIWAVCGIYSLFGAYCYAELGTMINRSGADYAYILEAFGPLIGFLRLWVEVMVVRPVSMAVIAMTFSKYMIQPLFPDCQQPEIIVKLLAAICILLITFVNCYSVKLSTCVQDIFTYAKLLAILLIIITGFVQIAYKRTEAFEDAFEGSDWSLGGIATGLYSGLFAYSGWNYLNCMIEEMKNPKRHLPIAIVISCIIVTVGYCLCNVAYFTTVNLKEILTTPAVAVTFAQKLFGVMAWVMPLFVAFSTFGGVNGTVMTTSRIFFVAGEEGQMPQIFAFINIHKLTPIPAVIFTSLISLIYLMVDNLYVLINYLGFVQNSAIMLSIMVLIIFRVTRKNAVRPIRVPILIPIIYISCSLFLTIFSFVGAPIESLYGVAIIFTGVPIYILGVWWSPKPEAIRKYIDCITINLQKILQLAPQS